MLEYSASVDIVCVWSKLGASVETVCVWFNIGAYIGYYTGTATGSNIGTGSDTVMGCYSVLVSCAGSDIGSD